MTEEDCVSKEDTQIFSKCQCALSLDGTKRCNLFKKDKPWQEAITKFQLYYNKTVNCHVARRWQACGEYEVYKEWKCALAKARYHNV